MTGLCRLSAMRLPPASTELSRDRPPMSPQVGIDAPTAAAPLAFLEDRSDPGSQASLGAVRAAQLWPLAFNQLGAADSAWHGGGRFTIERRFTFSPTAGQTGVRALVRTDFAHAPVCVTASSSFSRRFFRRRSYSTLPAVSGLRRAVEARVDTPGSSRVFSSANVTPGAVACSLTSGVKRRRAFSLIHPSPSCPERSRRAKSGASRLPDMS